MAVSLQKIQLSGLARKLVTDGHLDAAAAQQAHQAALKEKIPLVSYLVNNKLVPSSKIALAASHEFGVPLLDINAIEQDKEITKLVKEDLIKKHHALPVFKRGKRLYLALSDPTNLQALDEIKFAVGMSTDAILVEEDKLSKAIDKALEDAAGGLAEQMSDDGDLEDLDNLDVADESKTTTQDDSEIDDAPVVRFVNKCLLDAIRKGASDLHFEPYEKYFRLRIRIDGVLEEVAKPPLALAQKIAARIKVMSRLDVSERRVPQDGRIKRH